MTTYYKFLDADGRGQYSYYQWPLPTANADGSYTPGAWVEVSGGLIPCVRGLHAIANTADLPRWVNITLYTLEYDGAVQDAGDKVIGRRARLLAPLPAWNLTALRWWALDCAAHVAHLTTDQRVHDCLAVIRRYLLGQATEQELRQARRRADAAYAAAADAAAAAYAAAAYADAAYAAYAAAAAAVAAADAAAGAERQWQGERLLAYATGQLVPGQEVTA